MFAFLEITAKKAGRGVTVALISGALLLGGCASGITDKAQLSAMPKVRPDNVYVYTFSIAPDQVKLDEGGLASKLASQLSGVSSQAAQVEAAAEVQEALANEIVQKLQSIGLRAMRSKRNQHAVATLRAIYARPQPRGGWHASRCSNTLPQIRRSSI
jgi:hypothetical protein